MSLLSVQEMTGGYGGMTILNGLDLAVEPGEIVVLIGPNGAGKSTAMKAIFGLVPVQGKVRYQEQDIISCSPDQRVRLGLAYVPQERNVFRHMSVKENLQLGAYSAPKEIDLGIERVFTLFPPLKEKASALAGELSGGQRQMVAIGRALMLQPTLLLLDEPTAGLSPLYMEEIFARIEMINKTGTAILLVEQNARQALAIGHRGYVLVGGKVGHHGPARDLLCDPQVSQMFLGGVDA